MNGMIQVLGIDPSLTATALVRLDEKDNFATRVVKPQYIGIRRLIDIEQDVLSWAQGVNLIAIEGYAFGAGASREALGELGGVLKCALWRAGLRAIVVPPAVAKKFATGRGNAKKDEMRLAVYKKWGLDEQDLRTADEVDAYVLAQIALVVALRRAGREVELLKYEAEALKSLKEVA